MTLHSIDELAEIVRAARRPTGRTIVGLVGAPGSGKSTIAAELAAVIGPTATVLPMDGFHLPQATLVALGRRDRMGAPDTFDVDGLVVLLEELQVWPATGSILAPGFDRTREEAVPDAIEIASESDIIVLEGNYLLLDTDGWERVGAFVDVSFFVDTDHELRIARLIARHERYGKDPNAARDWALGPDESNARLIEATDRRADHRIALG